MLIARTTFNVLEPLKLKTQCGIQTYKPGYTFRTETIDAVRGLLESRKIKPAGPCHICHEYEWWLSIYGVMVCGTCHPPASPGIVKVRFSLDNEATAGITDR